MKYEHLGVVRERGKNIFLKNRRGEERAGGEAFVYKASHDAVRRYTQDELLLQHITVERSMYAFKAWRAKHPKIKSYIIDGEEHSDVSAKKRCRPPLSDATL